MLAALDLPSIVDAPARARVRRRRTGREDGRAALRAAQAAHQRLRDARHRLTGAQGRPTVQAHPPPPPPTAPAAAQARRQPQPWAHRSITARLPLARAPGVAGAPARWPPEAGAPGYEDGGAGRPLPPRQRPVPSGAMGLPVAAPPLPRRPAAGLPRTGRAGRPGLARGCAAGAQRRAPRVAECWRRGGGASAAGQGSHLLSPGQAPCHAAPAALAPAGRARRPWQPLEDTRPRGNGPHGDGPRVGPPLSTASGTTAATDRRTILDVRTHPRPRRVLVQAEALGVHGGGRGGGPSGGRRWRPGPLARAWMPRRGRRGGRRPGPAWGRRHGRGAWRRWPWQPRTPPWRGPWCAGWGALTRRRGPWSPRRWRWAGGMQGGTRRRGGPPSRPTRRGARPAPAPRRWTHAGWPTTRAKQRGRRRGLAPPARPLPHHPAARGARARVRSREVRCGLRTREGATAWDTCRTLAATATTRGGRCSPAMHARVSGTSPRPSLAALLVERAHVLTLAASWDTA